MKVGDMVRFYNCEDWFTPTIRKQIALVIEMPNPEDIVIMWINDPGRYFNYSASMFEVYSECR